MVKLKQKYHAFIEEGISQMLLWVKLINMQVCDAWDFEITHHYN